MIRVKLPHGKSISALIDEYNPTWRKKNKIWDGGKSSPWSEIKPIFVGLQFGKCGYCETRVQYSLSTNKYDSDIEHFRPKNRTTSWLPNGNSSVLMGYADGYFWLATKVENYLLSCKTCYSELKGNNFPIAGHVGRNKQTVRSLNAKEKPYLIFPIGTIDDDPETLIEWHGLIPKPVFSEALDSYGFWRAKVTIELFQLDLREDLLQQRAEQLLLLWEALSSNDLTRLEQLNKQLDDNRTPHAACIRAFLRLFLVNPDAAKVRVQEAQDILAGDYFLPD